MLAAAILAGGLLAEEEADAAAAQAAEDGTDAAAQAEEVEDPGFERYKTILDRLPFGPEPENFNPDNPSGDAATPTSPEAAAEAEAAAQQEEAQKIIAAVRVSALNVTPKGSVAVGFSDNSKQPPATYYLKVGETRDGWTVKEADAQEMTVTLEKDGVDATLKLGEGSDAKDAKKGGGKVGSARRGMPGHRGSAGPRAAAAEETASAGNSPLQNLRARQARAAAARREELRREEEAAEQAKAERARAAEEREQAKAEREQQQQTLQQIREELQRQREARAQQEQQERPAQGEGGEGVAEPEQE